MNKIIHRANSRGIAEHGWLHSQHTFSFAGYYNPERMGFGKLRVLNDDIVEAGSGFGTHPHNNMEIISIPLSGELRHADSMGNIFIIKQDEVQIMSAGTGITHSEHNNSNNVSTNFLQIWITPKQLNIKPRYEQKKFSPEERRNRILSVVAPDRNNGSLWINQDAWLSLADLAYGRHEEYALHKNSNGLYVFVISGQINVDQETLNSRDAIGITSSDNISIKALSPSSVLLIEVPMQ